MRKAPLPPTLNLDDRATVVQPAAVSPASSPRPSTGGSSSPRANGDAVELVLKIAKLSLSLVQCATSKDAKSFVNVIKELKPVLFNWKDEAAVYSGTNFAFTKAELGEYGTLCKAVETRLTQLLQKAKEVLSAPSARADTDAARKDLTLCAKALAESIQKWRKVFQTLAERAEGVRIRTDTLQLEAKRPEPPARPTSKQSGNNADKRSLRPVVPANRSGASTVIAKLREDDWNEDWEFDCKALLFSYIEQCKTFCMTRMDAGEKQQMLFDAIGKTITSWLSLSVSGKTDPRERAERSNAAAKAVELLASLAEMGRDRRTDTQQQLGKQQKRQQEQTLEDLESTTANLWDEREKDPRFIQIENGAVRCASLNQLVYKITDPDASDLGFLRTFLLTYKTFVTPNELFAKLRQRFETPESAGTAKSGNIQLRVYNVVKQWVQVAFADWDQELCDEVRSWISQVGDPKWSEIVCGLISKAIIVENMRILSDAQCTFMTDIGAAATEPEFLQMDVQLVADQITIFSSELFSRLALGELVAGYWAKEESKHKAPTVLATVQGFNTLSRWVQTVILEGHTVRDRAKLLTLFVRWLGALFKLNNLDGAMSVLAGLRSAAINRLRFTYDMLPKPEAKRLAQIEEVLDSAKNYARLREHLRALGAGVGQARVPYLGMYLTDITFILEGNADTLDGLVNWKKRELLSASLEAISACQATPYTGLERLDRVISFLNSLQASDEDTLYALSLQREPRNVERADVP